MPVYLVGYDLRKGSEDEYAELIETIKKIAPDYWHCLDSTWLIVHSGNAVTIRNTLQAHLDRPDDPKNGDKLLVALMGKKDAAWTASFSDNCKAWLARNL